MPKTPTFTNFFPNQTKMLTNIHSSFDANNSNVNVFTSAIRTFAEGAVFQLRSVAYVQLKNDNGELIGNGRSYPVIEVKRVGANGQAGSSSEYIFISMLMRERYSKGGEVLKPNGTFNADVAAVLANIATDTCKETETKLNKLCKKGNTYRKIVCRCKPYENLRGSYSQLVSFDYVDDDCCLYRDNCPFKQRN